LAFAPRRIKTEKINKIKRRIQSIAHIDGSSSPADSLIRAIAIFGGGNDKRSLRQHQFRLGMGNLQLSKIKKIN
jgi:hypothetical protein